MSKCSRTLTLLRPQLPKRSIFTGLPSLPSASYSISNPSIPPPRSSLAPQAIATSSRFTLDHPFWFNRPDPATSALAFATDDELFHSLLLPSPSPASARANGKGEAKQDDWTATFDPALAFLAIRSRPTYTAFLQCVYPFLNTLYPRLKEANQHELLVSDLLLRHPDPRLLRDLLELDAQSPSLPERRSSPVPTVQHLRPSLVASIHSIIAWQIRRGSLRFLSYRAHLLITRAMQAQGDVPGLIQAWHDLRLYCPAGDHEASYNLLSFVLYVVRSDPAAAFGMLHALVRNDKLPRGILLRGLGEHPRRREILVLGAVIRCCHQWMMDERARVHAGELMDLILDGNGRADGVKEAVDQVLEACRAAVGARDPAGLEWSAEAFSKLSNADRGPSIPGPLFDAWLDAVSALPYSPSGRPKTYALDIWASRPSHARPPVSAQNILRLSTLTTTPETLLDVLKSLSHLDPSTTLSIATPLLSLISARDIPISERRHLLNLLLQHWAGSLHILKGSDLVRFVRTLRADRVRCTAIMKIYEARLLNEHHRRGEIKLEEALAMVHTYLLVKNWGDAEAWLEGIDLTEEVKWGLWEIGLGNGSVRMGLKRMLRKRCEPGEVKRILAGAVGKPGKEV